MKKILSVMLIACMCCGMFSGCGGEKSVIVERKNRNDYENAVLVDKTFYGLEYQVPAEWEEKQSSDSEHYYFFNNIENIISLQYIESDRSVKETEFTQEVIESITDERVDVENIKKENILIENSEETVYSYKIEEINRDVKFCMIDTDGGYVILEGTDNREAKESCLQDFEQMCKTIKRNLSESVKQDVQTSAENSESVAKAQHYNQKSSEINNILSELESDDKYSNLIENWRVSAHSLDNSCDISVEFQAAADVRVGTVSAIRNTLCDIVLSALPEVNKISVNFNGIGTYNFTVGDGWDREVTSSDSE